MKKEERYGEEFNVEYFLAAKDSTYDNILTLSNQDGVVFNAYQCKGYTIIDNYMEALINKKLTDYIISSQNISSNLKVTMLGMVRDGSKVNMEYIEDLDLTSANKDFIKIIIVIAMKDKITEYKDELFDIYQEMLKYDTEVLEFEVISYNKLSDKLSKTLNNPLGYYDNNWDTYREISSYIDCKKRRL